MADSHVRLVLDTATLVAAIRSDRGASNGLLAAGLRRRFVLLVSVPLMLEYEAVLTRPEHLHAARLSRAEAGALLDAVAAVAEPVILRFLWRPRAPDPDDDMVLETAVNGRADGVATFNLRDLDMPARRFGIVVARPADWFSRVSRR